VRPDQKFFFTELLDGTVFQFCRLQGCPNLIGGDFLLKFYLNDGTAGEIYAEVQAAVKNNGGDSDDR
jgi:hypothetical protein